MAFLRRLVKGSDKKDPAAAMEDNTTTDPLQDVTSKTADLSLAPGDGVEEFSVATFALSWFWFPEAQFGCVPGVIRTKVGFTGGSKKGPTYHSL